MSPRAKRVQEGAAGIGVDLNEAGRTASEVKVVAHQGSAWTKVALRYVGCPGQNQITVGVSARQRFYRAHNCQHRRTVGFRQEDRHAGEQMWAAGDVKIVE